ncbi:Fur family transcriptional regulator [Thermohalobacter berrensis]|uniref:Transcriptional repressor n=1 Tax=Thermohalobacter berrensis TaxID=99594 RepID=A0A419SWE6_9FIRM|nr:Fur family transcriptional regulator [Thermohalobacter berrensis]RKD29557.1 hypothetical protein BET03_05725 [Thermohalobacter berrensis]
MISLKDLKKKVKENGYKLTPQRKAILKVLIGHNKHFISAEDILKETIKIYPNLNITTIYRNLEILEDINMLHKTKDNNTALYCLICEESHHHHIICKICGKTEIIDFCPLKKFSDLVKEKNFILTDHKIELYGYCEDCKKDLNP